jgi:hypothetical protein
MEGKMQSALLSSLANYLFARILKEHLVQLLSLAQILELSPNPRWM